MAREILEERAQQWGDPVETHEKIAQVWSAILGYKVQAWQVSLCMVGMKLVRAAGNPTEPDNYDDIPGYSDITKMIVGLDEDALEEIRKTIRKAQGPKDPLSSEVFVDVMNYASVESMVGPGLER